MLPNTGLIIKVIMHSTSFRATEIIEFSCGNISCNEYHHQILKKEINYLNAQDQHAQTDNKRVEWKMHYSISVFHFYTVFNEKNTQQGISWEKKVTNEGLFNVPGEEKGSGNNTLNSLWNLSQMCKLMARENLLCRTENLEPWSHPGD